MVDLVTGGAGFIGSHVVDKLVEQAHSVRVFDKVKPHREDVEWFKGDLLNLDDLLEACADVDTVYHLGAIADVNVATSSPELCIEVNEIGTLNLMQASAAKEVERVVLASSTWVYGRLNDSVTEETPLPPPDNIYTKTKIGQEHVVASMSRENGVPYTILRYDIPYGPRMRSNLVIAAFVRRASNKEPISIFGDGEQGRCWIYVDDLALGNVTAGTSPKARNEVINLAGDQFVTVAGIVDLLREHFGDISVERKPTRPGDFRGVMTSIDKARRLLGWAPATPFKDGLERYLEWYSKLHSAVR